MKSKKLRVAVIISPDIQDKYLASHIVDDFNVVGIFIEPQYRAENASDFKKRFLDALLESRFNPLNIFKKISDIIYYKKYLKRVESIFIDSFSEKGSVIDTYEGCPVYYTDYRDISSPENVELLKKLEPDVIVACGCSILKENLLEVPPHGTINLHSGLAPYYKGCQCYFWPLYNDEPEYAGVTVHYVDPGIDEGNIIHQGRPEIEEDDDEVSIFVKMMNLGAQLMVKTVHEIEDGTVRSFKQTGEGKLYLDNMTTVRHYKELHKKLRNGLIRKYLTRQKGFNSKPNIIE